MQVMPTPNTCPYNHAASLYSAQNMAPKAKIAMKKPLTKGKVCKGSSGRAPLTKRSKPQPPWTKGGRVQEAARTKTQSKTHEGSQRNLKEEEFGKAWKDELSTKSAT